MIFLPLAVTIRSSNPSYHFYFFLDANDQTTIRNAMQTLMYAVGTPIAGSTQRKSCVYFRPRQSGDTKYFKIQYGNGCSAHVSESLNPHL